MSGPSGLRRLHPRRAFATVQNAISGSAAPPTIWESYVYPADGPSRSDGTSEGHNGASPIATSSRITLDHFPSPHHPPYSAHAYPHGGQHDRSSAFLTSGPPARAEVSVPAPPIWKTFVWPPPRRAVLPRDDTRSRSSSLIQSSRGAVDHLRSLFRSQSPHPAHVLGLTPSPPVLEPANMLFDPPYAYASDNPLKGLAVSADTTIRDWSGAGEALQFATDDELVHALLLPDPRPGPDPPSDQALVSLHDWRLTLDPALAYLALRSRASYPSFLRTAQTFVRTLYPRLRAAGVHQLFVSDLLLRHPDPRVLAHVLELDVAGSDKIRQSLVCSIYAVIRPTHAYADSLSPLHSRTTYPSLTPRAVLGVCRAMAATSTWTGLERAWTELHDISTYSPASNHALLALVLDLLPHRRDRALALFSVLVTAKQAARHWADEETALAAEDDARRRLPAGVLRPADPAHPLASEILVRGAMVRACLRWKLHVRAQGAMEELLQTVGRRVRGLEKQDVERQAVVQAHELLWEVCGAAVASADKEAMDWVRRMLVRVGNGSAANLSLEMDKADGKQGVETGEGTTVVIPGSLVEAYVACRVALADPRAVQAELVELYTSLLSAERDPLSPATLLYIAQANPPEKILTSLSGELDLHAPEDRAAVAAPFSLALFTAGRAHYRAAADLFLASTAIFSPSALWSVIRALRLGGNRQVGLDVIAAQEHRLEVRLAEIPQGTGELPRPEALSPVDRLALAEGYLLLGERAMARRQLAGIRRPLTDATSDSAPSPAPGQSLMRVSSTAYTSRMGFGLRSASPAQARAQASVNGGRRNWRGRKSKKAEKHWYEDQAIFERVVKDEVVRVVGRSPEVGREVRRMFKALGLDWALVVLERAPNAGTGTGTGAGEGPGAAAAES